MLLVFLPPSCILLSSKRRSLLVSSMCWSSVFADKGFFCNHSVGEKVSSPPNPRPPLLSASEASVHETCHCSTTIERDSPIQSFQRTMNSFSPQLSPTSASQITHAHSSLSKKSPSGGTKKSSTSKQKGGNRYNNQQFNWTNTPSPAYLTPTNTLLRLHDCIDSDWQSNIYMRMSIL